MLRLSYIITIFILFLSGYRVVFSVNLPNSEDLTKNVIVSYYGRPFANRLGILGENSILETSRLLKIAASEFHRQDMGVRSIIPAFHIIYGLVLPNGLIKTLNDEQTLEYIKFAAENNMLVILDHQIGKYSVNAAMKSLLPWLKYPNVHLALDPEWATVKPSLEIGSVNADRINEAQEMMSDYLQKEKINQNKLLVVHQFVPKMIKNRNIMRTDYENVILIHNFDGFGKEKLKRAMYKVHRGPPDHLPLKGFKLFYPKSWKTDGFDVPLMTPEQVLRLDPKPVYVNYQ